MYSGDGLAGLLDLPIDDMDEGSFLDHVGALGRAQREIDVRVLEVAHAWAIRSQRPPVPVRDVTDVRGERVIALGADGGEQASEMVGEFSPATLGARLGMTTYAARELMSDAIDLARFFPELWGRVKRLEVKASYARHAVKACRAADLDRTQMAQVDSAVAESADGRIPWSRYADLVAAAITTCDVARAREAELRRRKAAFAKRLPGVQSGMASFLIRASVNVIERIEAAIASGAKDLEAEQPELSHDDRCVAAALAMATGECSGSDTTVHLHAYASCPAHPEEGGFSRIDHAAMVTNSWVNEVFGADPAARITIRPVLDIEGLAPVDSYEIPARHRRAVTLAMPVDMVPWGNRAGPSAQIDHTIPWRDPARGGPPGQTTIGNLGPLSVHHHLLKTHGRWDLKQPFVGIFLWRDPGGQVYLVDATGTRALATAA